METLMSRLMGSTEDRQRGVVLVTMVILVTVFVAQSRAYGCTWRSAVSATLPETQTVEPNPTCSSGNLLWNNPRGCLVATFRQTGPDPEFSLCLGILANQTLQEIYNVTSPGSEQPIGVPLPDNLVCVDSENEFVKLKFEATDNLDTMAVIEYYITLLAS